MRRFILLIAVGAFLLEAHAKSYELSFGIRNSSHLEAKLRKEYPLAFQLINRGTVPIPEDKICPLFFKGRIHWAKGHKTGEARVIPKWRTAVYDVAPGKAFECPSYAELTEYFPDLENGTYRTWWTLDKLKSNVLLITIQDRKVQSIQEEGR